MIVRKRDETRTWYCAIRSVDSSSRIRSVDSSSRKIVMVYAATDCYKIMRLKCYSSFFSVIAVPKFLSCFLPF